MPEPVPCQAPGNMEEMADGPRYRPLLTAAFMGDWESARAIINHDHASVRARITSRFETVLHIATLSAQDKFVKNLLDYLNPDDLLMVDSDGCTALHNAVHCGRIEMVKALVGKDRRLTQIPDYKGRVPLRISTQEASTHKEIAWFLAKKTTDDGPSYPFSSPSAINPILDLTYAGHHDITLFLVKRYPHLLTMKRRNLSILGVLARMQTHFLSVNRLGVFGTLIFKCPYFPYSHPFITDSLQEDHTWLITCSFFPPIKRIHEVKLRYVAAVMLAKKVCEAISAMRTSEITEFFLERNLLGFATTKGNSDLVKLCIQSFPELIRIKPNGDSLMTLAVKNRQERILSLFLKKSSNNELSLVPAPTPEESEKMMLAAAKYDSHLEAVTYVSGAAFEMQRELQWFKAVEKWLFPNLRTFKHEGKSYWQIFTEEHQQLLVQGGEWVKNTAQSCMVVSTLIATVLFAASYNVPKGNSGITGNPLWFGMEALMVFEISDALGLFSSVTAIMLFLAILTSRYEAQDFLHSLPRKIIMGLSFLILSLACMLVAFGAAYKIVQQKRPEWVYILFALLSICPFLLFLILQIPLLGKMAKSTYGRGAFRPKSIWK
ncbi:uncharacterized protein LOC115693615 [Syzygium oleosum]|uniref:uncharacterized protein LOC115693615 n=1 Tax=Syzygium oleosum TaxID=219896 RepID=UPI0024B9FF2A|nr:uncharacterized protein LOC115693615 [Syzygium oleosum]